MTRSCKSHCYIAGVRWRFSRYSAPIHCKMHYKLPKDRNNNMTFPLARDQILLLETRGKFLRQPA